jgi:hypothetical protein
MLSEEEEDYIYGKVVDALRVGDPIAVLTLYLPVPCMDLMPRDLRFPDAYAREAIRLCRADAWNNLPCWMLSLFKLFPAEHRSAAIAQRLANPPAFINPDRAKVLVTEAPFFDRESVRTLTRSLRADRAARPILIVNGERESGKSYTFEYVDHLFTSTRLPFFPFRVRFDPDNGQLFGPEELAGEILRKMRVSTESLPQGFFTKDTNDARWSFDLAGKVLTNAPVGKRFWIVLDNFYGPNLRPDTAKFIDGLARWIIDSSEYAQSFRLILLHFERSLLSVEAPKVDREEIGQVSEHDIRECVREIFERSQGPPSDGLLQATVERIIEDLPASGRLKELNERLFDLIRTLQD